MKAAGSSPAGGAARIFSDCGLGRISSRKFNVNPIRNPPFESFADSDAPVAQREEARGSDPRQWGFDSLPEYRFSFGEPKEKKDGT